MTHQRNTKGLAKAAKQRRQDTIKRVNDALKRLSKLNKRINFNTVAKEADVGKPWLYKEKAIRNKIEALRLKTHVIKQDKIVKTKASQASEKSKESLILMLKEKVRTAENENKKLKKQIEVLYGELYSKKK